MNRAPGAAVLSMAALVVVTACDTAPGGGDAAVDEDAGVLCQGPPEFYEETVRARGRGAISIEEPFSLIEPGPYDYSFGLRADCQDYTPTCLSDGTRPIRFRSEGWLGEETTHGVWTLVALLDGRPIPLAPDGVHYDFTESSHDEVRFEIEPALIPPGAHVLHFFTSRSTATVSLMAINVYHGTYEWAPYETVTGADHPEHPNGQHQRRAMHRETGLPLTAIGWNLPDADGSMPITISFQEDDRRVIACDVTTRTAVAAFLDGVPFPLSEHHYLAADVAPGRRVDVDLDLEGLPTDSGHRLELFALGSLAALWTESGQPEIGAPLWGAYDFARNRW